MTETPMPCGRCGQVHASCSAHRRDGAPCGQKRMRGQRVCKMHGGKTPGARERAAEREATAAAEQAIAELVPLLATAEPVKDPVETLARMLRVLEQMADNVAARVNELNGKVGTGEHLAQLRAEVILLDRIQDRLVRGAGKLADLGLAERHVQLEAARAEMVVAALVAAIDPLALVPEVRAEVVARFLGGLVVAGGLDGGAP